MGCILSFFKFNQSYKVAESSDGKDSSSSNQGKKGSKKQQSGQQSNKPDGKNDHQLPNQQSFIYKTVLETTVSDAKTNEEEARKKAEEAPGPFEIETDLLSPEIEEAVIKLQANVRGYLTRKQYRATPERSIEKPLTQANQEPVESSNEASSGILAPPPSFSDTPKDPPDEDNETVNQGKRIAEKLIELEKQVSRAIKPFDNGSEKQPEETETNQPIEPKLTSSSIENQQAAIGSNGLKENTQNQKPLVIPSIETDLSESQAPEEAATKIQAAFRGYQVRKTISRETSPCKSKDSRDDELIDNDVVHLREKNSSSTQDHERESILVLNQLEECLSKELMKSSSYSADIDLDSSINSNSSLIQQSTPDKDCSVQSAENDKNDPNLLPLESNSLIIDKLQESSDNKSLTADLQNYDNLSSTNADKLEITQSPVQVDDKSDVVDSSSTNDETILNQPVVFVSSEDKVDAADYSTKVEPGTVKQENEPVVLVELQGKLDASSISELSLDIEKESDAIIQHEVQTSPIKIEPKLDLPISMETEDIVNKCVIDDEDITELEVIQVQEKSKISFDQEKDLTSQPILSSESPATQESKKPDTEISLMSSPFNLENVSETIKFIEKSPEIDTMPEVLMVSDKTPQEKFAHKSADLETSDFQKESQNIPKLLKDNSFGSDILILDDETIDKSDTLYDIIADKGLNVAESSGQEKDSLDISAVGFSLSNADASESITEIKDDILVNLDESDEEEDNLGKISANEVISTPSESTIDKCGDQILRIEDKDADQLLEEKVNISDDSVAPSHLLIEEPQSSPEIISSTHEQTARLFEVSHETHVQPDFKESSDENLKQEQLEKDDMIPKEMMIKPIKESFDEQTVLPNIESQAEKSNSTNDPQSEKQDESSAIKLVEKTVEHSVDEALSHEDVKSQETPEIKSFSQTETDPKTTNSAIEESDLSSECHEILKEVHATPIESSPLEVNTKPESEYPDNSVDQSISQTPVTINIEKTTNILKVEVTNGDAKILEGDEGKIEPQLKSIIVQDDSSIEKSETKSELLSDEKSDEKSKPVSPVDEPTKIEISSEFATSSTESTPTEESTDDRTDKETEDSNPDDDKRLLRIHERDARSKSPNPFGRKRRKGKKNRNAQ